MWDDEVQVFTLSAGAGMKNGIKEKIDSILYRNGNDEVKAETVGVGD